MPSLAANNGPQFTSAEPRTAFVVNFDYATTEDDLKGLFSPFGNIVAIRIVKDQIGRSKGYAYIEFETEKSAQSSLTLHGTLYKGRSLKVSISSPPSRKNRREDEAQAFTVYVSGLPEDIEKADLEKLFGESGKLKDVRVIKERVTGKPKGFAYVEFEDSTSAENALKLDKSTLKGKSIGVARSAPPRGPKQTQTEDKSKQADAPKEAPKYDILQIVILINA